MRLGRGLVTALTGRALRAGAWVGLESFCHGLGLKFAAAEGAVACRWRVALVVMVRRRLRTGWGWCRARESVAGCNCCRACCVRWLGERAERSKPAKSKRARELVAMVVVLLWVGAVLGGLSVVRC